MKRFLNIFVVLTLIVSVVAFSSCSKKSYDKVSLTSATEETTTVATTATTAATTASQEKSDPLPKGITIADMANRSYELNTLFAVDSFKKAKDLSVNVLVQYAFCHLYYDNLIDMPTSGMKTREATQSQINEEIKKQFDITGVKITEANLYNAGSQKFEMWQPNYGTKIYYDSVNKSLGKHKYRITTTFYTDADKKTSMGTTVLTALYSGKRMVLQSLTSK